MSVAFFGQYLVEHGYINVEQLRSALTLADTTHLLKFAVAKGILLPAEVAELCKLYGNQNEKIVEKAIKHGMLDKEQLESLQSLQASDLRLLGAKLLDLGFIRRHKLEEAFNAFRAEQAKFDIVPRWLPEGMNGRADALALLTAIERSLVELAARAVPPQAVYLSEVVPFAGEVPFRGYAVLTETEGDSAGRLVLTFDAYLCDLVCRGLLGMGPGAVVTDQPLPAYEDALCEFCGNAVGASAAVLAGRGHALSFSPPARVLAERYRPFQNGARCLVQSGYGTGDILID